MEWAKRGRPIDANYLTSSGVFMNGFCSSRIAAVAQINHLDNHVIIHELTAACGSLNFDYTQQLVLPFSKPIWKAFQELHHGRRELSRAGNDLKNFIVNFF